MLQDFQHIRSRARINQQLDRKYDDVLHKFSQEIAEVQRIFNLHKDAPPHAINMPPVAGAVKWARSLFQQVKSTVVSFQQRPGLLDSEMGRQAGASYLEVAREILGYEKTLHKEWCLEAEDALPKLLQHNILKEGQDESLPRSAATDKSKVPQQTGQTLAFNATSRLQVDYSNELRLLLAEAKYLDILELEVPQILVNITLQEEKHHQLRQTLRILTERLHKVLSSLDSPTQALLEPHLRELAAAFQPGVYRLNWNSLGVADFAERCTQALSKFQSVLIPVQVSR